jgi:hypothetical protein
MDKEASLRHLVQGGMEDAACGRSRIYNVFTEDTSGLGEVLHGGLGEKIQRKQSSSAGSCVTRVELASLPIERNGNKMYVASRDDLIGINIKDGSKRAPFLFLPINVTPSYPGPP